MSDDIMPEWFAQLFAIYGPAAIPILGLLLIIKYLLDKDKQRETAHSSELVAERQNTKFERDKNDGLQTELLKEARGNAMLAEELKKALIVLASKGIS